MISFVASFAFWTFAMSFLLYPLTWILNVVGVVALPLIVVSALSMKLGYRWQVPINRQSLRLVRWLSWKSVKFLLYTSSACLLGTQADRLLSGQISPWVILLCSGGLGLLVVVALGNQGLGLPLGPGLTLTMDRAPKLRIKMTKSVLSFHVDARFRKERRAVTTLVAQAMNDAIAAGNQDDFLLKSWMFARKGIPERYILRVRRRMSKLPYIFLGFPAGLILLALFAVVCERFMPFLSSNEWLFWVIGGSGVVALAWVLLTVRYKAGKICLLTREPVATASAETLGKDLERLTTGYHKTLITWRPIPLRHIFAMGALGWKITNLCSGMESGVVMRRSFGSQVVSPAANMNFPDATR